MRSGSDKITYLSPAIIEAKLSDSHVEPIVEDKKTGAIKVIINQIISLLKKIVEIIES